MTTSNSLLAEYARNKKRMLECPYRGSDGTANRWACGAATASLEFVAYISIDTCDSCAADGKASSTKFYSVVLPEAREAHEKKTHETAKRAEWEKVRPSWEGAVAFLQSVASALTETLSAEDLENRNISCFGTTAQGVPVQPACSNLRRDEEGRQFCGACGCGKTALSALGEKLKYPQLECPLRRKGFSNEERTDTGPA